ncbi:Kinase, SCY1 [Giardia muris]|uniref:Kinase, SCY1 n=1 Tax=Giardia muris TaxID=5742 RepID=A0A4Z1SX73_GIAMU|nr:Kinase, SCY1 [Giardia muris]|eukprot:TNJ28128.1 Kinase, SCY1 [Giardia muris]
MSQAQYQQPTYFKCRGEPRPPAHPPRVKLKDWECGNQIGFGGTFGLWHMFQATHKKTGQQGTIFAMEKKATEKAIFGKGDQTIKHFWQFISKDATIPGKDMGDVLTILESMQDDGSVLAYVTEPLVTTLAALYCYFGHTSLSFIKQQADNEMLSGSPTRIYSVNPFASLLQYIQPDAVAYGYATLLRALLQLHTMDIVFGNITPANIAITQRGEWKPVGFTCCLQGGINFDYSSESGALLRPCAHYMSPNMLQRKKADRCSDAFQLASTIYTVFGDRPCKYSSKSPMVQHMSTEELCGEAERMFGACLQTSPQAIAPNLAAQNAQTVARWYAASQHLNPALVCLSQLDQAMPGLWRAAKEECNCGGLYEEFLPRSPVARVAQEVFELKKERAFVAATPQNSGSSQTMQRTIAFLTKMLPVCIEKQMLSIDLTMMAIWNRLVIMLGRLDTQPYVVSALINYTQYMGTPVDLLYVLFEPIVLSCTLSTLRDRYPGASSSQQAWTTGVEIFGRTFRYLSPYASDKNAKERDKYIPNMDKSINAGDSPTLAALMQTLIDNATYFTAARAGARAHFGYMNFILTCLTSENPTLQSQMMIALARCAHQIGDSVNWMTDNAKDSVVMASNGVHHGNASKDTIPVSTMSEKYTSPIAKGIAPVVLKIIVNSQNDEVLGMAMQCLGALSSYVKEEDLATQILPAVYSASANISKSPKGCVHFASFANTIYKRCSARSVAGVFMPVLLKGMYHQGIDSGAELEMVRKVAEECFSFINQETYQRAQTIKPAHDEPPKMANPAVPQAHQQPSQQVEAAPQQDQQSYQTSNANQGSNGYNAWGQSGQDQTQGQQNGYGGYGGYDSGQNSYGGYNYGAGENQANGYGNYGGYGGDQSGGYGGYGGYDAGNYGGNDYGSSGGYTNSW